MYLRVCVRYWHLSTGTFPTGSWYPANVAHTKIYLCVSNCIVLCLLASRQGRVLFSCARQAAQMRRPWENKRVISPAKNVNRRHTSSTVPVKGIHWACTSRRRGGKKKTWVSVNNSHAEDAKEKRQCVQLIKKVIATPLEGEKRRCALVEAAAAAIFEEVLYCCITIIHVMLRILLCWRAECHTLWGTKQTLRCGFSYRHHYQNHSTAITTTTGPTTTTTPTPTNPAAATRTCGSIFFLESLFKVRGWLVS